MQNPRHFRVVMYPLLCGKEGSSHFIWILRVRRVLKVGGSRTIQAPGTWGQVGQ